MATARRCGWRRVVAALVGCALLLGQSVVLLFASGAPSASAAPVTRSPAVLSAQVQETPTAPGKGPGLRWLEVEEGRKTAVFVPASLPKDAPVPLVVLLHGAGAGASDILPLMRDQAEAHGFVLLAPQSAAATWDVIAGAFGHDLANLDRGLAEVFSAYRIDPEKIAIAGFSDGASYALSVGLPTGGCSDTSWRSPQASLRQPPARVSRASSSRTAMPTRSSPLIAAAGGSCRPCRKPATKWITGSFSAGMSSRSKWSKRRCGAS